MPDRYDQDLLLDYLEGDLDDERRAQLEAMLAEDAQLAALLRGMAADRAALRSLPAEDAPGDLAQDVIQGLERRMLLDDAAPDAAPIPLARGRQLVDETHRGPRWGRIAGLSGLAASVAIAATIVVLMNDDPLLRTASELAEGDNTPEVATDGSATPTTRRGAAAGPGEAGGSTPTPADTRADDLSTDRAAPASPERSARPSALAGDTLNGPFPTDDRTLGNRGVPPRRAVGPTVDAPAAGAGLAAIAAGLPRQQLVLLTDAPELTREQFVMFCVNNGIPIVQTSTTHRLAGDVYRVDPDPQPEPADAAEGVAEAQASPLADNYAMLIDRRELDNLVLAFNHAVIADPAAAPVRGLASNQIALVTDYAAPAEQRAESAQARPAPAGEPGAAGDKPQDPAADAAPAEQRRQPQQPQEAIEVRLPDDLGNAFANGTNRRNYENRSRQGSYIYDTNPGAVGADGQTAQSPQPVQPQAAPGASVTADNTAADQDGKVALEEQRTPAETEAADANETERRRTAQPQVFADDAATEEADSDNPELAEDNADDAEAQPAAPAAVSRPGPARGNWLAPALPLARTTPIWSWRHTPEPTTPELVPVVIQRAPAEQVNQFRQQQLTEQSRQPAQPEAAPDQPSEEPADQPAEPDRAQPAE